ncbi:MAG: phytase [Ignavibacteriales bacterium]|nr:phytase [Ignavibacteriales bacterium]
MKKLLLFLPKNFTDPKLLFFGFIFVLISTRPILSQQMDECSVDYFEEVILDPDFEVSGAGDNIDTIEFWKAPDSTESLMFVSAKGNQLVEVWKYPFVGNEMPPLTHATFSGSQVNGLAVDQESSRLYVAIGEPSSTVSVFSLPDLNFLFNFNKAGVNLHSEPNLTILKLTNGDKRIYVSADDIVYVHDAVSGDYIDEFTPETGLETMAADNFYQRIYIPDENGGSGLYVYNPDGTAYLQNGTNHFGNGIFDADAEGIIIFNCPAQNGVDSGYGLIVVSDQIISGTNHYEFFDRQTWEYLGTLKLTGVSNTDGIASLQQYLPDYPAGLFAALNNDSKVAAIGWDDIFSALGLTPVEMTVFTATAEENKVKLKWQTVTELNNSGFEVQRKSGNENEFKALGFVQGKGNSMMLNEYYFEDLNLNPGVYSYRLKQIDFDGTFEYSNTIEVEITSPTDFSLEQNYPNPFNPTTKIKYTIPSVALRQAQGDIMVSLKVFDVLGIVAATLVNETQPAGSYELEFDVGLSSSLSSGVYYYQLKAGEFIQTRKMILLK